MLFNQRVFSSVFRVDLGLLYASSRLSGSVFMSLRNGSGATQFPALFFSMLLSMISTNFPSSTDNPGLSSSSVRTKTFFASPSSKRPPINCSVRLASQPLTGVGLP